MDAGNGGTIFTMAASLALLLGVSLDRVLGEPRRWHPLVWFGRYAAGLELALNRTRSRAVRTIAGTLAWGAAVLPWVALAAMSSGVSGWLLQPFLLYFALGARSLSEHGCAVARPLEEDRLPEARQAVSHLVSRDTGSLDRTGVATAAVESILENGNDAIFGALFWFAVLGGPGALLFRLANTLDAMWGYRTDRFRAFGWAAARIDDGLGYLPARLTALTYALVGRTSQALACWRRQAPTWDSPNAGPVMAAGAGALDLRLGGPASYQGVLEERPLLGCSVRPDAVDIRRALKLVRASYLVWIGLLSLAAFAARLARG